MGALTPADRVRRLANNKQGLKDADASLGRAAWHWGNHLKDIRDNELWREDNATSFSNWCDTHLAISRRTANRAIALCQHFTEEMAGRFGSRRLSAALEYIELTGKIEQPGDILALQIRFRGADGQFTTVPFPKATVKQIDEACKQLREAAEARAEREKQAAILDEVRAQIQAIAHALPAAPPGTVRGERIVTKVGTDGTVAVSTQGVPVGIWLEFLDFLKGRNGGS